MFNYFLRDYVGEKQSHAAGLNTWESKIFFKSMSETGALRKIENLICT